MVQTGVGKTEIARRLAKLANAPFIKVEATKFTEVGYVGKEVDSIIRDLTDVSLKLVRQQAVEKKSYTCTRCCRKSYFRMCLLPPAKDQWGNVQDSG